ncbi:MAG: DUF885 domain-containing protein [Saprospiraceae bacterium]
MKNIFIPFFLLLIVLPNTHFGQKQALDKIITDYQEFQEKENDSGEDAPSVSKENYEKRAIYYKELMTDLAGISIDELDEQDRINHELLSFILEDKIANIEFKNYLVPMNAEGGWYSELPTSMERRQFRDTSDYRKYFDDLKKFQKATHDNLLLLTEGMNTGRTLPHALTGKCRKIVAAQAVENFEDSPYYLPIKNIPANIADADKMEIIREGKVRVHAVNLIYQMLLKFLDEKYIPKSNQEIGIIAQPQGREIYEQRVRYFTTLKMTPEEVYEIGQSEVARIKKEMEGIIEEVGFSGSFAEFLNFLRTDEQFYAKTPEEILKEASFIAKKIDGLLPKYFGKLPRNSYGVQPVPAAIAPTYTSGRYSGGSLENGRAGNYWVNTTKLNSRPLYALPSLTLHEAVPGHHLQISLAQEMEGMPDFRKQTYLSAYGEGWALYTEWLGEEMGVYSTPYERFGKLTYEMWRACRLVVDPGLHVFGMSRQEAIDFMSSNTALSIHECTTEIDRYIGWPGQAVSYKIGELKIRKLRRLAELKLGDEFNIREFHDLILSNGAVPLFVLERMVKEWLEKKK